MIHQYACQLYEITKQQFKNPATLNSSKLSKMLTECGVALELVNAVLTMFETVDDAHHAAPDYSPNRQKIRQYYEIAVRLSKVVDVKIQEGKTIAIVAPSKTA